MSKLRRWSDWVERRLEAVVKTEGLRVGLADVKRGPMTLTYRLQLIRPNRQELGRLKALGPVFNQAVRSPVRVVDRPEGILVEVAVPPAARQTPPVEVLTKASTGFSCVAVGVNAFKRPVFLDFDRWPHLLTVGPTRRGKSTAIASLLFTLAARNPVDRFAFVVMAKKSSIWLPFAPVAHCFGVMVDPVEIEAVVAWLAGDILQQRAAQGIKTPRIFAVVDDMANVVSRSPGILEGLGEIASMGGEAGLHLIVSTQLTGKQGGLTQALEGNFTARLIFGAADASAGARFAGRSGVGVESVGVAPGDALLLLDGQDVRVATARLDPRLISTLPFGDLGKPWASPQNTQNAPEREERPHLSPPVAMVAGDVMGGIGEERDKNARSKNTPLLDPSRPPTAEERQLLRDLFAELGTKEAVCLAAWGRKNGIVYPWLLEALDEDDDPNTKGSRT